MKITIYTITDCQFSKQEKEYLTANKLAFEEKNLETNKEFLTEMLTVSNNFAGTPVTKIEKDDGQIAVLKGFTKEEFDKVLGFSVEPVKPVESAQKTDQPTQPTPTDLTDKPTTDPKGSTLTDSTDNRPAGTAGPTSTEAPQKSVDPAMANVLNTLQAQAEAAPVAQAPAAPPMPSIPDPKL